MDLCRVHADRPRLNVTHHGDEELDKIVHRLEVPILSHRGPPLVELFKSLSRCAARPAGQELDLISHSTATKHLLDFDGWHIGKDRQVLDWFCSHVEPSIHRFRRLRLIGCGTASTDDARRAMGVLQSKLGIEVVGTAAIVSLIDFHPSGYFRGYLVDAYSEHRMSFDGPPETRRVRTLVPDELVQHKLSELRAPRAPRVTLPYADLAAKSDDWVVDDHARYLPGLLTRPRLEVLFTRIGPHISEPRVVLAEVLFNWTYLRVYPTDVPDGLLYRLTPELRAALEAIPANHSALATPE